jgi:plasmid stabilization system protein ParE
VIVFDTGALDDLERIFEFNAHRDPATAMDHVEAVQGAVAILDAHPEIGDRQRRLDAGKTGYVALYSIRRSRS